MNNPESFGSENFLENYPELPENTAICVIKPDAFRYSDKIVELLEEAGLEIVKRVPKVLSGKFVIEEMYGKDKLPKSIENATLRHFMGGKSEVVVVKGDDAINKLLNIVGLKTSPAQCDPESARAKFGDWLPERQGDGKDYFMNAVHRPMNREEAEADYRKFWPLIRSEE